MDFVQGISALTAGDGEPVAWDAIRSARMLAVGLFMSGPLLHLWFGRIGKVIPGRDIISTLKKLVLGQVFFGPAFCAAFFVINSYAQGDLLLSNLCRNVIHFSSFKRYVSYCYAPPFFLVF